MGYGLRPVFGDIDGDATRSVEVQRQVADAVNKAGLRTKWNSAVNDPIEVEMLRRKRSPTQGTTQESDAVEDDPSKNDQLSRLC